MQVTAERVSAKLPPVRRWCEPPGIVLADTLAKVAVAIVGTDSDNGVESLVTELDGLSVRRRRGSPSPPRDVLASLV